MRESRVKRLETRFIKLFIVALLPVVLSGCVNFGVGGGRSDPQGEFLQGGVVKGFPPVPVYPKAQIGETYGNGSVFGASLVSGDSLAKILDFYRENLTKDGWETDLNQLAETNYVFGIKNATYQGKIIVNTAVGGKKTAITISLLLR